MDRSRLKVVIPGVLVLMMLVSSGGFAEPAPTQGNPDTNASDRNYDTNQPNSIPGGMQKAKDGGNRALNHVDQGVHKGAKKARRAGHKAKVKANETVNDLSEPAIKPQ